MSGVVVFEVDYIRDDLGRIDVTTERVNGATKAFDYDYDLAGRLTVYKRLKAAQEEVASILPWNLPQHIRRLLREKSRAVC
ncbi:MAG: hypothetical protein HY791_26800 [Deltaproteobacteria bacterium]|nr:hypothetical protein [Deltaproteobacteria bacterium]